MKHQQSVANEKKTLEKTFTLAGSFPVHYCIGGINGLQCSPDTILGA